MSRTQSLCLWPRQHVLYSEPVALTPPVLFDIDTGSCFLFLCITVGAMCF